MGDAPYLRIVRRIYHFVEDIKGEGIRLPFGEDRELEMHVTMSTSRVAPNHVLNKVPTVIRLESAWVNRLVASNN
jgi:hypothetical protein